jgi:hypothetical protein
MAAFRFSTIAAGSPWIDQSTAEPVKLNAAVAKPGSSQVVLDNGTTVKLVGVMDTQAKSFPRVWNASGIPIHTAAFSNALSFSGLPSGIVGRAVVVETSYLPSAQPASDWRYAPSMSWRDGHIIGRQDSYYAKPNFTWMFDPDEHIKELDRYRSYEVNLGTRVVNHFVIPLAIRANQKSVSLRYAVASGPWMQSITCKKTEGKVYVKTPQGQVIFTLISNPDHLSAAKVAQGNAVVMVSDHFLDPSILSATPSLQMSMAASYMDRELLALDSTGHVIAEVPTFAMSTPDEMSAGEGVKIEQSGDLPNRLMKQVSSLRLLVRPYKYVEFRGIHLQPDASAK